MKSFEYYIDLRIVFEKENDNEELFVTIAQLADIFRCTTRNVKFILKKLAEHNWITWQPGGGRGNRSKIIFKISLEEILTEYFRELIAKGKMNEAISILNQINLPVHLKGKMQGYLQSQFGFHVEQEQTTRLDILKIPQRRKLSTMDPAYVSVTTEAHLVKQIFDTLVNYNPETDQFEPHLVHSWEYNTEKTIWTLYLRKGVYFHDGSILTAKDVKYTFERLADEKLNAPSLWHVEDIEKIEIIDNLTFALYLKKSNAFILHFLSSINMSIVPSGWIYSEQNLIGTGPFKVREYTEEKLIFERFPYYFKETALLDIIEFWFIPHNSNIQLKYELPLIDYNKNEKGSFTFYDEGCHYIAFNFNKKGIQHDINFRKALRVLFDRITIINDLKGNRYAPADSFLSSVSNSIDYPVKGLEEAKSLIKKSGYKGETLKLYFFDRDKSIEDAEWFNERAKKIGLNISLHPFPTSDFYEDYIDHEADLIIMAEVLEVDIELSLLKIYKHQSSFVRRFLNPAQIIVIDRYMAQFMKETDKVKRMSIMLKVEDLLKEHTLILFNYHIATKVNYHPALKGISLDSFGWPDFRRLWNKPDRLLIGNRK